MIIGYSFWGFLGPGITNTPDGGRSHRHTLVQGLADRDHQIMFLQPNRDLSEADTDLTARYSWQAGLPNIDVLFLEWRWPIPGRNTTECGTSGHTCDLHRQDQLVTHYTDRLGVPTILWDKDRRLPPDDRLRRQPNVTICEPAIAPTPGAVPLLFPVDDDALNQADPHALAHRQRDLPLVYVGNQYDRDDAFTTFFAPAAEDHRHLVAGKWTQTQAWPHVCFIGRIPYTKVEPLHRRSLATVLLLPDRYAAVGQVTQRLFEAVLSGCLPITPTTLHAAHRFAPRELHADTGSEVSDLLTGLLPVAGTERHAELIAACLSRLDGFRLSRQLRIHDDLLAA